MKDPEAILAFIVQRIGRIYERPMMYGGSAQGVDLILHCYHELWAEALESRVRLDAARSDVQRAVDCPIAQSFAFFFRQLHPDAPEGEIVQHVVRQWRLIDDAEVGLVATL